MLNLVLSLSLSHTGHWEFNMAPHGKELSEDLKKIIVALHKDCVGYKKIAKTLKLSCSTVAKTIQRFNRTGSTQNRPCHGRPKKLSARAQRHIQRLCLGNRRMSAASIAAEVEGVGGQPVSAQTIHRTLHQIGLHGCHPRRKPLLKMMHKKVGMHRSDTQDRYRLRSGHFLRIGYRRDEADPNPILCILFCVVVKPHESTKAL